MEENVNVLEDYFFVGDEKSKGIQMCAECVYG